MIASETLLTLPEAATRLPRINGRKIHASSLYRWASRGIRGVRLETRRLGRRLLTSLEALDRFSCALAELDATPPAAPTTADAPATPSSRTDKQREAAIARAEQQLKKAGFGGGNPCR